MVTTIKPIDLNSIENTHESQISPAQKPTYISFSDVSRNWLATHIGNNTDIRLLFGLHSTLKVMLKASGNTNNWLWLLHTHLLVIWALHRCRFRRNTTTLRLHRRRSCRLTRRLRSKGRGSGWCGNWLRLWIWHPKTSFLFLNLFPTQY